MNKLWVLSLFLGFTPALWADVSIPLHKIHPPYFLQAKDKLPRKDLACPDIPLQGPGGQTLDVAVDITPPGPRVLDRFSSPSLFEEIQRAKASETKLQRFYWHSTPGGLDYCHFKDLEGNQWYGWGGKDSDFNWVLWRGHRFWWHDPFAGHWLYYYRGYWWRADGQEKNSIQACIHGEYYACDAKGNILEDMGQDGSGDIVSAPGRYQGDSHHGGHGGHGSHGEHGGGGHLNHNGGQPGQGSPQGGNPASGQNSALAGSPSGN